MNVHQFNAADPNRPWAQTTSGRPFPLLNPTPADVYWPDVASALAHINRYCGNCGHYSVAQHSILVADDLPHELRPYGLLHDAEEFCMGDMTRPTKLALIALGADFRPFEKLRRKIRLALYTAAGLGFPVSDEVEALVKRADLRVTLAEKRDVVAPPIGKTEAEWLFRDTSDLQPTERRVEPWSANGARLEFLHELRMMGIEV